jgi:hypothetical protein
MTDSTGHTTRIVAEPPFDPEEPQQPLRVSRPRIWIGIVLLISGFAIGSSSSLFPAAKLWLVVTGLVLIVSSFCVLGLHRFRTRGRHPRKLYGCERI